jgi:hypothetical protein
MLDLDLRTVLLGVQIGTGISLGLPFAEQRRTCSSGATTFQFIGGHLDEVPIYAENIIKGVGIAMLNWARLEQQLDALLISVNKPDHSTRPYKPTPHVSFTRKVDLLETWFGHDPRFKAQHDRASRLVKAFKLAADDRNLLTLQCPRIYRRPTGTHDRFEDGR